MFSIQGVPTQLNPKNYQDKIASHACRIRHPRYGLYDKQNEIKWRMFRIPLIQALLLRTCLNYSLSGASRVFFHIPIANVTQCQYVVYKNTVSKFSLIFQNNLTN